MWLKWVLFFLILCEALSNSFAIRISSNELKGKLETYEEFIDELKLREKYENVLDDLYFERKVSDAKIKKENSLISKGDNKVSVLRKISDRANEEMPSLPDSFTVHIEVSAEDSGHKNLRVGKEQYDGVYKAGVIDYRLFEAPANYGENIFQIYEDTLHYDSEEILSIIYTGTCSENSDPSCNPVKRCQLMTTEQADLYQAIHLGFISPIKENAIFGALGILQWGPTYETEYTGPSTCRGMVCDKYETIIRSTEDDNQVHIVYFWSGYDWPLNSEGTPVPVAIEMTSTGPVGGIITMALNRRYDFYEFYGNMRPDPVALSPPPNVYCYRRNSSETAPQPPTVFAYTAEIVFGIDYYDPAIGEKRNYRIANTQTEFYDWQKKIAMLEYKPFSKEPSEMRYLQTVRRIDDFNQGISYITFPNLNVCNITTLSNFSEDSVFNPDGSVSMEKPSIFQDMDEPLQFNGLHWIRGMEAEVWVGSKRRKNADYNDTYVYYYAMSYKEELPHERSTVEFVPKHPIRFERFRTNRQQLQKDHIQYNVREYDSSHPLTYTLDVSTCYQNSAAKHFILDLPADSLQKVYYQTDKLLYAAQGDLAATAQISSIRINRIQVDVSASRLLFSMLPLSGVEGNSETADLEKGLDEAIEILQKAVNSGAFIIFVEVGYEEGSPEPVIAEIKPIVNSMAEVQRDGNDYNYDANRQYTAGDMAGLGIGMLLSTVIIATLGYFGYKEYRQPTVKVLPRVDRTKDEMVGVNHGPSIGLDHDLTVSHI